MSTGTHVHILLMGTYLKTELLNHREHILQLYGKNQILFQSGSTSLYPHQQCMSSHFPIASPTLGIFSLF